MLNETDIGEIRKRNMDPRKVEKQIEQFIKGIPYADLVKPAMIKDGVLKPCEETLDDLKELYNEHCKKEKIVKFVPASGAATRMFREFYAYLKNVKKEGGTTVSSAVAEFVDNLHKFAFYEPLKEKIEKKGVRISSNADAGDIKVIIETLLKEDGLNFNNLPKGLLPFHRYNNNYRTAFEEHLVEGAFYAKGGNNTVNIHMTVSPEHQEVFREMAGRVKPSYENQFKCKLNIELSQQSPSTDTIAVDLNNNPVRDSEGKLVFRPGGHGALIENLNALDADIVFIKNIDNVVPDALKNVTIKYKKLLGGIMLSLRERIFHYLETLENNPLPGDGELEEILYFLENELCIISPPGIKTSSPEKIRDYLKNKLNRPLRVCGMVENRSEPGGGPFWVKNSDESVSLQIVETSQIELSNPEVKKIFNRATHFNPVDILCSLKDHKGKKFDLMKYRNPDDGVITIKSFNGKEIKALELPGLWNGGMADWNTIFVEVPLLTFNPVKTIFDLLRPEHIG